MKKRRKKANIGLKTDPDHFRADQIKFYVILFPIFLVMVLPLIYVVFHAFKPMDELNAYPPKFVTMRPTLANFNKLMAAADATNYPVSLYLFNSVFITVLTVLLTVMICAATAYVLSKKTFRPAKVIMTINQFAMMLVPVAVAIPRFIIIKGLGLMDTYLVHILPLLAMPVGLFLVKQFVDQMPHSLIEAAQLDGCSDYGILFKIVIPIIKPALATVAILSFQSAWNSVDASQYYVTSEKLKNFAYYLSSLTAANGTAVSAQGMAAAAVLIMIVPNLLLFVLMQSKVMSTVATSGIK